MQTQMYIMCGATLRIIRKETRAQQINVLAAEPGNLNLIPGTHLQKERINSVNLSSDLHRCGVACAHTKK